MEPQTKRKLGLALVVIGFLMLLANAVDYLAGWNSVSSGVAAIGICLVAIGMCTGRGAK